MARPKKQTIEYFPHYVSGGKTLFILESEFGNDGYAFWFKLLELLGSTNGHVYDTRNPSEMRFLVAKTRLSEEKARKILDLLAELDAIDKELWDNGIIWCQNLIENVSEVYVKRKSDKPKKPILEGFSEQKPHIKEVIEEFSERKPELSEVSDDINPQSKVKKSKVKKSKVNYNNNNIENSCSGDFNIYKYMQQRGFVSISSITAEQIKADIEMYSLEEVKQAIDIADNNGKHTYSYVKGILEKRRANGTDGSTRQNTETSKSKFSKYNFNK